MSHILRVPSLVTVVLLNPPTPYLYRDRRCLPVDLHLVKLSIGKVFKTKVKNIRFLVPVQLIADLQTS